MTKEYFYDLQRLGRAITEYGRAMENLRAIKESREMIAKGLRNKYPNMKVEAIRETIWKQENDFEKKAQVVYDDMRGNAYCLGWDFDHKNVGDEVKGILRKEIINLKDINV